MVNLKHWLICFLFSLPLGIQVQASFDIQSTVSKSTIYQNERTTLSLVVNGADKDLVNNISPPNLSQNFSIISTSQSSSFSFVNGIANRSREYRYVLQPLAPGIFIIDPFKVTYNGKQYSTKPIRVVIQKGQTKSTPVQKGQTKSATIQRQTQPYHTQNRGKTVFLETTVSTTNIFIGETVDYSVKLYRRVSLWSSISIEQDDIQGVWQNNLDVHPEQVVRKNGQRYYELELLKKNIRPLSVGPLLIPSLTARFVVDPFSGEYQLASIPVQVTVNALPTPAPASFTGAIGDFTMDVLPPVIANDSNAFQLRVTISGTESIITPPNIPDTSTYRVLSAPTQNQPNNHQQFDYLIIPKITGEITIQPIEFSFFSKKTMDYITLRSNEFKIDATLAQLDTDAPLNSTEDIRFLKTPTAIEHISAIFNMPVVFNSIVALNILFIVILILSQLIHRGVFRSKNRQLNTKKIIRLIQQLSDQSSFNEMEHVLITVLNYFTKYPLTIINPKEIDVSMRRFNMPDALIKSTLLWVKNIQHIRYSEDKTNTSHHSIAESLKRILTSIIQERRQQ